MNLDSLNAPQQEAVTTTEGPLLLLAGAGSGKTRVITHRVAYLIEHCNVKPYNIMAITFTNKAAGEMKNRVNDIVGYGGDSVWVATFHSSCVRILRRYIDRIGYDNNFTIYDTDDQKSLMKNICKKLEIDTKRIKERAFLSAISNAKNELMTPDDMEANGSYNYNTRRYAQVYREYQEQLRKNNALDFDDLIMKTVELFRKEPEVLQAYQERFKYIMVDEYQDTNTAQFELIRLLADKYHNLCVVGDDDQSIYKFRGANIRNILNFETSFEETKVIKLEQNYRSTQNILDAANGVIHNNTERKDKALWSENGKGDAIDCKEYETAIDEAEGIVQDIKSRAREGRAYKDFAILYRTNAQARNLEEKFIKANVPYKIYGGINFYARKEIKDILSYLKTIDNGRDDLSVRRIINIPKRGIGAATIDKIQNFADEAEISFYEALEDATYIPSIGKTVTKLENFVQFISILKSKSETMEVSDFIREVIESCDYEKVLDECDTEEEAQDRRDNLSELISKAKQYEENAENPSLTGFLEEVALVAEIDSMDPNADRVTLMTIHSAKGLEFPIVYLAGMEDGLFPSSIAIGSDDPFDVEEERRLCYVGITRAKEHLTLSYAKSRIVNGERRSSVVSRFVGEIDESLLKRNKKAGSNSFANARTNNRSFDMDDRLPWDEDQTRMNITSFRPKNAETTRTSSKDNNKKMSLSDIKNLASPKKLDTLSYGVGDTVRHIKFGHGTVMNIENGARDFEVTVDFENYGVKKMYASFAKLIKCE